MKTLLKIVFIILISFYSTLGITYSAPENLNTDGYSENGDRNGENLRLQNTKNINDFSIDTTNLGQKGIFYTLIRVAISLKSLFYILAGLFYLILVLKLLFSDKTEETVSGFKKGILWISIGLIVMQVSYTFVDILYSKDVNSDLGADLYDRLIEPLISFLVTGTGFIFIGVMLYAFYMLVTANGDEEQVKSGRMSILYAIIGFIVIKFSNKLVASVYRDGGVGSGKEDNCYASETGDCDINRLPEIIIQIINWANSFILIIVIILIIYSGASVLLSAGDEEKLKKAKSTILYIIIGLFIILTNYLILTFFLIPETII